MVECLYRACIAAGLQPSEFWVMSAIEPWWFLSTKKPELFKTNIADLDELYQMLD